MKAKKRKKHFLVRRVTVDEKLADDLIRILVSLPAADVEGLRMGEVEWSEEKGVYVNSEDYADKMGIPLSKRKDFPFSEFHEGQVFLAGNFKIVEGAKSLGERFVCKDSENFLSIEAAVKKETKRLYYKVLEKGDKDV